MADVDAKLMARAIEIAQGGDPSPNPHVGSVVADGETILAEGFHAAVGLEHAEIVALREAGESARGKTLYVTLEPCNHEGRTPPCVDAILAAGIGRVVVGCKDPNPGVEGGGIERLEAAGVEVVVGVLEDAAATLTAFTAASVGRLMQLLPQAPKSLIVCGGGARNPILVRELVQRLPCKVTTADVCGWSADSMEAQAFAYLAVRSKRGLPYTYPTTTGAPHPMTGGVLAEP